MSQVKLPYTFKKYSEMLKLASDNTKRRYQDDKYQSARAIFTTELNSAAGRFIKQLPHYFFEDDILNYTLQPSEITKELRLLSDKIDIKASFFYYTENTAQSPLKSTSVQMRIMCRFILDKNNRLEFFIAEIPVNADDKNSVPPELQYRALKPLDEEHIFNASINTKNQPVNNLGNNEMLSTSNKVALAGMGSAGASEFNGSVRITNGAKGQFSPKYYSSGWKGGSTAKINTYSLAKTAKVARGVSTGASIITTGMAYNEILNGQADVATYADATVGSIGIITSGAGYFTGVQIPVVGEFVAFYGVMRLTWDVFFYLGANYGPSKWYGNDDSRIFH